MAKAPVPTGNTKSTLTPAQVATQVKAETTKAKIASSPYANVANQAQALIDRLQGRVTKLEGLQTAANTPVQPSAKDIADIAAAQADVDRAKIDAANAAELAKPKFKAAGTLIRYEAGTTAATRTPIFADGKGGEYRGPEDVNPIIAGSTGTTKESDRTLAKDTFANTLALAFGAKEATQPWVNEMYNLASGFYNTGSTIEESLNLSLYEAKAKGLAPQFTKRFQGVFDLQEKLQKGEAVTVPTIAEFIKTEAAMGDTLREAGLGDLATQEFLGTVIGKGNSLLDVGNLISKVFDRIDNAPKSLRDTLDNYFPGVDRVQIAKALLTGTEGAAALEKKVNAVSVLSAAGSQGVTMDLATASDIAARGVGYETALTGMGQVAELRRAGELGRMQGGDFTQQEAIGLTFAQDQAAKTKAERIKAAEIAKFQGGPGLAPSALRGRNARQQI